MTAAEKYLEGVEKRVHEAAGKAWHWAGNTDTGEPYLATWIPGAGRCQVLSIGSEPRSTTGPVADQVRATAREFDLGDPEELVKVWAHDQYGEPFQEPRLWFYTDLMADPARDNVVYEVAPQAASREDPAVYRADISGIRHPDAVFIKHSREDVERLAKFARAVLNAARNEEYGYPLNDVRVLELAETHLGGTA